VTDGGGATSIEYAVIAGVISIAIVASLTIIGSTVKGFFEGLLPAFQ
jgi:Flp pilus assembly pilin Flp